MNKYLLNNNNKKKKRKRIKSITKNTGSGKIIGFIIICIIVPGSLYIYHITSNSKRQSKEETNNGESVDITTTATETKETNNGESVVITTKATETKETKDVETEETKNVETEDIIETKDVETEETKNVETEETKNVETEETKETKSIKDVELNYKEEFDFTKPINVDIPIKDFHNEYIKNYMNYIFQKKKIINTINIFLKKTFLHNQKFTESDNILVLKYSCNYSLFLDFFFKDVEKKIKDKNIETHLEYDLINLKTSYLSDILKNIDDNNFIIYTSDIENYFSNIISEQIKYNIMLLVFIEICNYFKGKSDKKQKIYGYNNLKLKENYSNHNYMAILDVILKQFKLVYDRLETYTKQFLILGIYLIFIDRVEFYDYDGSLDYNLTSCEKVFEYFNNFCHGYYDEIIFR